MYGLVGRITYANKEFWVEYDLDVLLQILYGYRVHVVDRYRTSNRELLNAEIPAVVPNDDMASNLLPLKGSVELLVESSIKTECEFPDRACEFEVVEPILESG